MDVRPATRPSTKFHWNVTPLWLLFFLFLALKLGVGDTDVQNWSWWWVTAPLWVPASIFLVFGALALTLTWLGRFFE